jgi:chromosome segregation ATPase
MNAIEYIKKYQDTKKELDKSNENFYTVFSQLQKAQSEIEELKKQVAGWSAMAGRYASVK